MFRKSVQVKRAQPQTSENVLCHNKGSRIAFDSCKCWFQITEMLKNDTPKKKQMTAKEK